MLTLDKVRIGQEVRMLDFHHQAAGFRHKLLAMGLTPGVTITVIGIAPLGCPMQVRLRGYSLSLRKKECQTIEVEYNHANQQCVSSHRVGSHCACRQS